MKTIGITGGTGCGKTTALARIEALGGCVIDCDAVYHDLLAHDTAMVAAIEARFPGVTADGVLDRKKLGLRVFQDPEALQALSELTFPFVLRNVRAMLSRAQDEGCMLAAIDAIGLCESGLKDLCDTTLAVTAPVEHRVRRLMAREGISKEYARLRIAAQKPNEYFSAQCAHTLENDCATAAEFGAQCDAFFHKLLENEASGN